jgi:hypothetical protein
MHSTVEEALRDLVQWGVFTTWESYLFEAQDGHL